QDLLDPNHKALAKISVPCPGLQCARLATHPASSKQFNPHRSRSGSVQRILSAMLRPGLCVVPRELIARALRIESWGSGSNSAEIYSKDPFPEPRGSLENTGT